MVIRLLPVALSILVLSGTAGCGAGPNGPRPAATPSGLPPGTPLVDTLRTPPGTLLLGAVFPAETGITAVLLVTGDPLVAWSDLVNQAASAGFVLVAGFGTEPCWVSSAPDGWWDRPDDPLTPGKSARPAGLGCDTYGDAPANAEGRRRSLSMRMRVGAAPRPYLAHLVVRYRTPAGDGVTTPAPDSVLRTPAVAASPAVRPPPFPRVPGVGAPLGPPFFDEGYRVAEGSALVAPVSPGECAAGGFLAVLRVTGTTAAVVELYAAQFRRAGLETEERAQVVAGSSTGTLLRLTTAGGGDGTITAVAGADRVDHLLVERCND